MQTVEVIAQTDTLRVRIMSLAPREVAKWHFHNEVTDDIFCLTGNILVRTQDPKHEFRLSPGQRCQVPTGRIHQLENLEELEATYLLVQGIGKYDFNVVNPTE